MSLWDRNKLDAQKKQKQWESNIRINWRPKTTSYLQKMLTQKVQAKNIERNILVVHNGLKNHIMEKTKPNNLILDLTGNYYNDTLKDSSKRTQSEMKGTMNYPERDLQVRLWINIILT